jgi:hypothetical protein
MVNALRNAHMKSLSLAIQKIWPMLKFLNSGSNFKVKVLMVPLECSCHKEYTYEIPITYHLKDMANIKVFADRQTDRQTDGQVKNYIPPIFRYGGIKR